MVRVLLSAEVLQQNRFFYHHRVNRHIIMKTFAAGFDFFDGIHDFFAACDFAKYSIAPA